MVMFPVGGGLLLTNQNHTAVWESHETKTNLCFCISGLYKNGCHDSVFSCGGAEMPVGIHAVGIMLAELCAVK